jgi:transcriptional regulator with XRE-family HTH domain
MVQYRRTMTLAKEDVPRGERIKALRERYKVRDGRKKLTQASLAQKLGVDSGTVSRWELGKVISIKNIEKLASFFSVDPGFIAYGHDADAVATYPAFQQYQAWLDEHPEELEALPEGGLETIRTFPLKVPSDYEPNLQNYMVLHSFMTGLRRKKRGRS